MENISEIVSEALSGGEPQDNSPSDYIGEDGLLYCGKCHTPKQRRVDEKYWEFFGKITPTVCKCAQDEREREEREREERKAEQERRAIWGEWLSKCFVNLGYRECTFENDKAHNPELIERARDFVERFDYYKGLQSGLLFSGSVGAGKTYAAACIANELLKRGVRVIFRTESELLREACSDKSERLHAHLNSADLFILDDFGACLKSEKQAGVIFPYIDERSVSKKPLVVTTNLKLADFKETGDTDKARIYSRIIGACSIPVVVNGKDVRREISREKYGEYHSNKTFSA